MLFFPVDGNVELPQFTLCKWAASDDPEKSSEEAKSKDAELSPTKDETPRAQNEGTCQNSSVLCFYTFFFLIDFCI